MTRPWVRLVLVFAGLAAFAAAGAFLWSSELRIQRADASLRQATDTGRRALIDVADLRAAQQGYVAVGQSDAFWIARVSSVSQDLDDVLSVFRTHATSGEALAAIDAAAGALRDFAQLDARVREYTHERQLARASDVIFGDGFELSRKVTASLTQALVAETTSHDAAVAQVRRRQAGAVAAGAGVATVALLLLVPGGGARPEEPAVALSKPVVVSKETLEDLNDFGVVARPSRAPAEPPPAPVDLAAVATICGDLARVADTRAVPALLERAARVLDAAGIVVWIADPDGRELAPILVHGYSRQLASRLGTIVRDASNVTASAYRTGLLQTVKGDAVSNGAVAAPLLGVSGCLGVMALEMKNGGEQREPLLAAVTIIASQLSTLVGPPSARARTEAAG